ncbi:anti-sigma-F factor Fin family protein [Gorillibacterium massiliense]|uniref:anti-sigma-F factor Fin family protein n=1 Tax=Gorillibacterium massiliense TaxID=1280390 RepID=UPI0004B54E95|nr:anti-sigma-F factor Fin family protein [Gorillibacterium massiliense]
MAITYICRYCKTQMGSLETGAVDEFRLGLQFLTPGERRDIIAYTPDGGMTVKVVCEFCREALDANPELSLVASPLQ